MPTVVIVDDEPAIVSVVCDILDTADLVTVGCTESRQAHTCICRTKPDLVILDLQMPSMDGLAVFKELRADPATRGIPVIFLTASAQKLEQRLPDYQALGAELLPKPFTMNKLLSVVNQSLAS